MKRQLASLLLQYFRILAQIQLKKFSPTIIGITGSAGKTSTLQACEAVLTDHFELKVSHKANSESGIPLNILDIHPDSYSAADWLRMTLLAPLQLLINWKSYDIYLVEMGIDGPHEPKNMSYLLKIIKPDVGIFLNAAPTHAEPFDHLVTATEPKKRREQLVNAIATEKGRLITSLAATDIAILNADDEVVNTFKDKTVAKVLTFGQNKSASIRVNSMSWKNNSTQLSVEYLGECITLTIKNYVLPKSYAHTLSAAIGCGISQGLSLEKCKQSLETKFELPPGRSSIIDGINESHIIDSTYNASTGPTLDMLELLKTQPGKRKYALLGDMRELGEVTQSEHETIAKKTTEICDEVFLVGPYMHEYALPVIKAAKIPVKWFTNAHEAGEHLKTVLQKDDVILVKASQNTLLLEIAVEKLMAHPEKADELLCRRGEYWDKQRKAIQRLQYTVQE